MSVKVYLGVILIILVIILLVALDISARIPAPVVGDDCGGPGYCATATYGAEVMEVWLTAVAGDDGP